MDNKLRLLGVLPYIIRLYHRNPMNRLEVEESYDWVFVNLIVTTLKNHNQFVCILTFFFKSFQQIFISAALRVCHITIVFLNL